FPGVRHRSRPVVYDNLHRGRGNLSMSALPTAFVQPVLVFSFQNIKELTLMPTVRLTRFCFGLSILGSALAFMPSTVNALPSGVSKGTTVEGVSEYTLENG